MVIRMKRDDNSMGREVFALAVMLFPLLAAPAFAQEAPQLPHLFYGTAQVNGSDIPSGAIIVAKVDGVEVGSITTTGAGKFGGPSAGEDKLLVQGYIEEGAEILFFVSGVSANQAGGFVSGHIEEMGLTWDMPETLALEGDLSNQQIVCIPGMIIETELVQLSLQGTCETAGLVMINNVTNLGGTYFAGPAEGTTPASSTFEISITGDLDIVATITYNDTGVDESSLQVFKFDGASWVPIPEGDIISRDTEANTITFRVPVSNTPYTIFFSQPPAPSTPPPAPATGGGASSGRGLHMTMTAPDLVTVQSGGSQAFTLTVSGDRPFTAPGISVSDVPASWVAISQTTPAGSHTSFDFTITVSIPSTQQAGSLTALFTASYGLLSENKHVGLVIEQPAQTAATTPATTPAQTTTEQETGAAQPAAIATQPAIPSGVTGAFTALVSSAPDAVLISLGLISVGGLAVIYRKKIPVFKPKARKGR